ncbi:MAG: GNAT family N-acetyltransferase [Bacteroidales bacterium]|nr:GNAT family N-acetyltransferase [Bacteroidales bacterium]
MTLETIRPATIEDADFLGHCVCEGLGFEIFEHQDEKLETTAKEIAALAAREGTLYSFQHALVAEVDGHPVGALISYEGALYHTLRNETFPYIENFKDLDVDSMADEAGEGEFYLDTLAVLPQYRRQGIGRRLMQHRIQWVAERYPDLSVTLLVDPVNLQGQRIYQSLGFKRVGECIAFNYLYWKMSLDFKE